MNEPLVSVIIRTCFARRGCLQEAIASIVKQTYSNIELVIVENGSEGLESWLSHLDFLLDYKVSYYHLDEANRCVAGNLGLLQAKGMLLCFLDDDDQFYPNHMTTLVNALEKNKNVFAAYSIAHELPSDIKSYTPFICNDGKPKRAFGKKFSRGALFVNNYIPIQTILFKKQLFETFGGFDLLLENLEDWNLWSRYASCHDFIFVPEVTSYYRVPSRLADMVIRDKKLDYFYPMARSKQRDIKVLIDDNLLCELIKEILRSQAVTNVILSKYFISSIKKKNAYKNFCLCKGVNLSKESAVSNVLESIELANAIVRGFSLLWYILRIENFLKNRLYISQIKRMVKQIW